MKTETITHLSLGVIPLDDPDFGAKRLSVRKFLYTTFLVIQGLLLSFGALCTWAGSSFHRDNRDRLSRLESITLMYLLYTDEKSGEAYIKERWNRPKGIQALSE